MRHVCNYFLLVVFSFMLVACGGGESLNGGSTGGEGGGQGGGQGGSADTIILELALSNADVTALTPAVVTATVTKNGEAVVGEVVSFTTTLGVLDPLSGTVLTGDAGRALIDLNAGSVEGAGTVTATLASGETDSISFSSAGDASSSSLLLELIDDAGTALNPRQISSTKPGRIRATVSGIQEPVIVTFTSDLGNIPIPTGITNADDVAIVDIFASNSLGAGTIQASLASGESAQLVFSIGASSLGIGTAVLDSANLPDKLIDIPKGNLSAGGTTTLAVTIWDTSVTPAIPFTDAVDVNFSSDCAKLAVPTAVIDTTSTSVNGVATSTYLAQGCEGDDIVTATANAGGIALSASGIVTINPASVGSIEFVSAEPQNIALRGVGGTESSTLKFKVVDSNGNPVPGQMVDFDANTDVGGLSLSPMEATTNALGEVQTVVNSGTVHTSIRVTAQVRGSSPQIRTQSSLLVVSTGIPDQDSFSLSASVFNPEAWNIDGTEVTITARLADAFNNPAPDGTAVAFTTEGGSIGDSCVTTNGVCTVIWSSQNPRPEGKELDVEGVVPNVSKVMGQRYGGRATILATAIGEESFPDTNGNGVFDSTEFDAFAGNNGESGNDVNGRPFDLDEAFVDHNEDGVYNPQVAGGEAGGSLEKFEDFNNDTIFDVADGKYNGSLCGDDPTNSICSQTKSINIRGSLVLVMSGSNPRFVTTFPANGIIAIKGDGTGSAAVTIADLHNQPMPAGTTVEFNAAVGSLVGLSSYVWPSTAHNGGASFGVTVKGVEDETLSGPLSVTVTTPSGVVTVYTVATISITP